MPRRPLSWLPSGDFEDPTHSSAPTYSIDRGHASRICKTMCIRNTDFVSFFSTELGSGCCHSGYSVPVCQLVSCNTIFAFAMRFWSCGTKFCGGGSFGTFSMPFVSCSTLCFLFYTHTDTPGSDSTGGVRQCKRHQRLLSVAWHDYFVIKGQGPSCFRMTGVLCPHPPPGTTCTCEHGGSVDVSQNVNPRD